VAAMRKAGMAKLFGGPEVGALVTEDQLANFALCQTTVEEMAAQGFLEERLEAAAPSYRWTAVGVAAVEENRVADFLGNPAVGGAVTNQQLIEFADGGTTVDQLVELGYVEPQEQALEAIAE